MSHGIRGQVGSLDRRIQALALLGVLVLLAVPFATGPVQTRLVITILLLAVFATAFNLLYGYTGLLSFGHAMFVAVAAYTGAKVLRNLGTSEVIESTFGGTSVLATFLIALVLGAVAAAIVGVVIGWFCVQLEEIYFALLTLSFSMAFWAIFQQDISGQLGRAVGIERLLNTGGSDGLPVSYSLLGEVDLFVFSFKLVDIQDYYAYYFITLVVVALSMYAMWRIVNSPFGTTCKAIRENPERAEAVGIDRTFHSWMTFIISGTISGIVGVMLVPINGGALPNMAHWSFSALPVIMTVIGGAYAFLGPLAGSFVFEYTRELISQVPALERRWQLVFGVALLLVVLYFEDGVAGGLRRLRSRFVDEPDEADTDEAAPQTD